MLKLLITKNFWKKFNRRYNFFLILKFLSIKRNSYLTKKYIQKLIVKFELFSQKQKLLITILFNYKIVLI